MDLSERGGPHVREVDVDSACEMVVAAPGLHWVIAGTGPHVTVPTCPPADPSFRRSCRAAYGSAAGSAPGTPSPMEAIVSSSPCRATAAWPSGRISCSGGGPLTE